MDSRRDGRLPVGWQRVIGVCQAPIGVLCVQARRRRRDEASGGPATAR